MQRTQTSAALTVVAALTITFASWGWAIAQQQPPPRFQAETELVTIDVVATGAEGTPARGLTAADFEVFEDGQPRPIQAFQFIDMTALPPPTPLPQGVAGNQGEPGALFALVFDELGVSVTDVRDARRVAQHFFHESLQPRDYVTVIRSGADSGFFLTSDRTLALDAVAQSSGRLDRGLRLEQAGEALTGAAPSALAGLTPSNSGKASFDVLLGVVEKFRPISARRKAILWFSRGGDIQFENFDALAEGRAEARADDRLTRLIDAARAANVAIYTLDPRGLTAPSTDGAQAPAPDAIGALGTLRDLATATGGRAIVNANDLDGALDRIAEENRAYYLLGYAPAAGSNARRARKLQVRTRAPGVTLLHRSIYVPTSRAETVAPVDLLASPLPVGDLPILMAPTAVVLARDRRGIVVPFEIGTNLPDGADVEYTVVALNAAGQEAARSAGRIKAAGGRAVGAAQLPVKSETYQVRLAAALGDPSTRGLAFTTVNVPAGQSAAPACTGFIFEQPGRAKALRQFAHDAPLTILTFVSAKSLDGRALAFGLGAAGQGPQRTWPVQVGRPVDDGLWALRLSLNPPLPRGNVEITLLDGTTVLGEDCRTTFDLQ